jgi:tetratricopeptide (TPR) repeat protein
MSLLLDALKKSGDGTQKSDGMSGLSLEDASPARTSQPAAQPAATPSRAAGETLFAAKKKKPASAGFRWKLGLVPTTLLICSVIGAAYGYYVWLEIQPPKRPPVAQQTPAPVPAPAPTAVAAVPLVPMITPEEPVAPKPTEKVESQQAAAPQTGEFDAPRNKPKVSKPRSRPASDVAIQRTLENDGVTPALIAAWQAYQRGDYVSAAQGYRQVLEKDPNNRDALLGLAATSQQQGMDDAAQRYYRQLLLLDPRDPAANAALSAYSQSDAGTTESRLKKLLAEQPRSAPLHFALGNLYAEQTNWGDAQQYFFNAFSLEPSNAQYAFNLAVSLDHLGQGKLAAQHYRQALQLDTTGNSGFDHAQAQQRLNELTSAK